MNTQVTGGCKCGAVRYRGNASDVTAFRCYCRDCQHLTGAGHSEMMPLRAETFVIEGNATEFEMTGDSGKSTWGRFCATCGSPLTRRSARSPERVYVHAGSLDDPRQYQPGISIFAGSAQPWDTPDSDGSS